MHINMHIKPCRRSALFHLIIQFLHSSALSYFFFVNILFFEEKNGRKKSFYFIFTHAFSHYLLHNFENRKFYKKSNLSILWPFPANFLCVESSDVSKVMIFIKAKTYLIKVSLLICIYKLEYTHPSPSI